MSWGFVFALGVTAFAFKVLGLVLVGDREMPPVLDRCLVLIPAALIAAIVVKDTFSIGQHLQLDARAVGARQRPPPFVRWPEPVRWRAARRGASGRASCAARWP